MMSQKVQFPSLARLAARSAARMSQPRNQVGVRQTSRVHTFAFVSALLKQEEKSDVTKTQTQQ
jgi:hypothetical protein